MIAYHIENLLAFSRFLRLLFTFETVTRRSRTTTANAAATTTAGLFLIPFVFIFSSEEIFEFTHFRSVKQINGRYLSSPKHRNTIMKFDSRTLERPKQGNEMAAYLCGRGRNWTEVKSLPLLAFKLKLGWNVDFGSQKKENKLFVKRNKSGGETSEMCVREKRRAFILRRLNVRAYESTPRLWRHTALLIDKLWTPASRSSKSANNISVSTSNLLQKNPLESVIFFVQFVSSRKS